MSWGSYVHFKDLKVAVYIPRKQPEETEETLKALAKRLQALFELDCSGVYGTKEELTLLQLANIIKCAEIVEALVDDCEYPQYLVASSLYILNKDIEIKSDRDKNFQVIE